MQRRTPVIIVCSSRPRVGKTLLARVLAEFYIADGRGVAAFDVNPDNFALVDYLPGHTAVATLETITGEMALFDQAIADDQTPKVIDLDSGLLERFFSVMAQIDFLREATRRGVSVTPLFLADPDKRSLQGYNALSSRFPDLPLAPVINEAVPQASRYRDNFVPTRRGGPALTMPTISPVIRGVIERPGFSFASFMVNATDTTTELYGWTRQMFLEFRELELRRLMNDLRPSLNL